MYAELESVKGFKLADAKFEQDTADYERERAIRANAWQNYRVNPPAGAVEERPKGFGPPAVAGGWMGDRPQSSGGVNLARVQEEYPHLTPAIEMLLPPGPNDNNYDAGPKPMFDPASTLGLDANAAGVVNKREAQVLAAWQERYDRNKLAFDEALKASSPKERKDDADLREIHKDVSDTITTLTPELTADEVNQINNNQYLIVDAARDIAMTNGLNNQSAIDKVLNMIRVDPQHPELPNWRYYPHPSNPGIMLVQPMGLDGPDGVLLQIPNRTFDPLQRAWHSQSEQIVGVRAAGYASKKAAGTLPTTAVGPTPPPGSTHVPGITERVVGAVTDLAIPESTGPGMPGTWSGTGVPGEIEDWLNRVMFGGTGKKNPRVNPPYAGPQPPTGN